MSSFITFTEQTQELGNDHLAEIQLIKIVFYQLIKTLLISWPNFWTLFSWSKLLIMISVKRLKF